MNARANGWTSPTAVVPLIIYVLSTLMAAGGAYLAIARDDTQAMQGRLGSLEREMAGLMRDVEWLKRQERRE